MSWDLLFEIGLDTGTVRLSLLGSKTEAGVYEAAIGSVSDLVREIQSAGGVSSIESGSFEIRDQSGAWRMKLASTTWKKRTVTIKLADRLTGEITTVGVAKIEQASLDRETIEIDFRDDSFDRLEERVSPLRVFPDLFPNMPQTTPVALIPIPLGTIDSSDFSGRGHLPAYLVDPKIGQSKYRYVAAQIASKAVTAVYREGEELTLGTDYEVAYANVSTPEYGNVRMTFLDFYRDQRERGRDEDVLITYDCQGLTDDGLETGNLITNPAAALKAFLELRGVISSSEFDSTLQTAAEAAYTSAGITVGMAVVDEDDTWLDVVDRFAESYNLQFFRTRTGKFGIRFDNAAGSTSSSLPHFFDSIDIQADSVSFETPQDSASTLEFSYAQDWARGELVARNSFTDSTEETALGRDVRDQVDLVGVRSVNQGKKLSQIKLFQGRSSRYFGELRIAPYPTLELGDHVNITHFAGPASDGLGFRDTVFQVLGIALVVDDNAIQCELRVIDAPGLSLSSPADTEPTWSSPDIPPESAEMFSDVVWTAESRYKVSWSANALKVGWRNQAVVYSGIALGDTGVMNAGETTFVYFDPDVNTAAYQATTNYQTAIGGRKRIVAVCKRGPSSTQLAQIDHKVGFVSVNSQNAVRQTTGDQLPTDAIEYRHIRVGALDGKLITGATIRTSATNPRIELDSSNLKTYDASGNVLLTIPTAGGNTGQLVLTVSNSVPGKIVFGSKAHIFASVSSNALNIQGLDSLATLNVNNFVLLTLQAYHSEPQVYLKALNSSSSTRLAQVWLNASDDVTHYSEADLLAQWQSGSNALVENYASSSLRYIKLVVDNGTVFEVRAAKIGLFGATPSVQSTGWSVSNVTTDKVLDADATTLDELADFVGTLAQELLTKGLIAA